MPGPGRNDPCPCGSGKKYKHCCLARSRPAPIEPELRAASIAIGFLHDRYRRALEVVAEEFFAYAEDLDLSDLSPDLDQMLDVNMYEWVLAESLLDTRKGDYTAFELLTLPGGPLLSVEERGALRELSERPLRLYEVVSSDPGVELVLLDVVLEGAEPFAVRDRALSGSVSAGQILGLRRVRRQRDGAWMLSGAIYPIPRVQLQLLREEIRELEEGYATEDTRVLVGGLIVGAWLRQLAPRLPDLVDRSTGEPILLTTDHYRVVDRKRLTEQLDDREDLQGDAEGWFRVEPGTESILWHIGLVEDELRVFTRTRARGDESRGWLEAVAGDAVAFRVREYTDPLSGAAREGSVEGAFDPLSLPSDMYQSLHEKIYANWSDEPIPALGDVTPREAISTPLGRERVTELLLSYEHAERSKAADEGREPVDFEFLWEQIGLERP
jgi:hypothetical protein